MPDKVGDAFKAAQDRLREAQEAARRVSAELAEKSAQESLQRAGGGSGQ